MALPIRLTHAEVARAFVDRYRPNFKAIQTYRNTIEVWVKGDNCADFTEDVKRYHLRRALRAYLDWVFKNWPEPEPVQLQSTNFLSCVLREVLCLIYDAGGITSVQDLTERGKL